MPSAVSHKIDDYEPLLIALQNVMGIVVPEGKRTQLLTVLKPLLSSYKLASFTDLADKLQDEKEDEIRSGVLDVITRGYSDWFLSEETKTILHKYVLGQLPENARIWVVGCGQGQLAFTIAMEIANHERITGVLKKLQIIASDVSMIDIQVAQAATYNDSQLTGMSEEYKRLYLTHKGAGHWQVKNSIRQRVSFSQCDLTENFQSLGHMDLIISPEILVYYSNSVKASVLEQFSALLQPAGILITENNQVITPFTKDFERVDHPDGVFYRQTG